MDSDNFASSGQGNNNNIVPPNEPSGSAPIAPGNGVAPAVEPKPAPVEPAAGTIPTAPASSVTPTTPVNETAPTAPVEPVAPVTEPVNLTTGPAPVTPVEQNGPAVINPAPTNLAEPSQAASVDLAASSEPVSKEAPTEMPKKKSSKKAFMVLGSCLIVVAIIIVIVFLVPFGEKTLWQQMSGGSGGIGGGGGSVSNQTVNTGGYTYTTNLDLEYAPNGYFHDGLLTAKDSNGKTVFLDTAGKLAFELDSQYAKAGDFADGLMPVECRSGADDSSNDGYGARVYVEKKVDAGDGAKYGYINKTGELVIPCQFSRVEDFMNGYAAVATSKKDTDSNYSYVDNYWGVIDTSGNVVVDYNYENIEYESGTFLNKTFEAVVESDGRGYIEGCFDFDGNMIKEIGRESDSGCAVDPQVEEGKKLADSFEAKLGKAYRVGDFSEGLASVASSTPMEFYFIDTDGNKVWSLDVSKAIDVDEEEYQEGLFLAFMWVGSEEYPGAQELERIMRGEGGEEYLYKNAGAVYYDHSGNPVFIYRYARSYDMAK